jgi:hypothetical protein
MFTSFTHSPVTRLNETTYSATNAYLGALGVNVVNEFAVSRAYTAHTNVDVLTTVRAAALPSSPLVRLCMPTPEQMFKTK